MFDPYHKWLGIAPKDQPPNHYRLLGIDPSESDTEVIDAGANRQMAYLQQRATGEHAALSQKLLNEVAAARLCLLNEQKKAVYDGKLKRKLSEEGQTRRPSLTSPIPADPPEIDRDYRFAGLKQRTPTTSLGPLGRQSRTLRLSHITGMIGIAFLAGAGSLAVLTSHSNPVATAPEPEVNTTGGWMAADANPQIVHKDSDESLRATSPDEDSIAPTLSDDPLGLMKPKEAVYTIHVSPTYARLRVRSGVVAITGVGPNRTVRVSGETAFLEATYDGYEMETIWLRPKHLNDKRNILLSLNRKASTPATTLGTIVSGNVALASNGTKVTGPHHGISTINDGEISDHAKIYIGTLCVFTLPEKYRLNVIRILLWRFGEPGYRYKLEIGDGTNYSTIADQKYGLQKGWQEHRFPPRPVKYIRVTGTHNPAGDGLRIEELEAYCSSSH